MKLLTKAIEKLLPDLYATDGTPAKEKKVIAKFFDSRGRATWLAVEYSPEERRFFGYADVQAGCAEWGYFSLDEFESLPRIERDAWFKPCKFADCVDSEGNVKV
jgi:hypothetical protein